MDPGPTHSPLLRATAVLALALGLWSISGVNRPATDLPTLRLAAAPLAPPRAWVVPMTPQLLAAPARSRPRNAEESTRQQASPGQTEICGYGPVERAADDPDPLQRIPPAVRSAALDAADASMLASPDPQVRAAALLIGAHSRGGGRARTEQLVRLAVGSSDARVYAIALEACRGAIAADEAGACSLLNRAQWVRLDADNAQPWLELAAEARQRQDDGAEADAMRRAALALRSESNAGLLPSLVDRAFASQTPSLQRTLALSASWGVQAAWNAASPSAQARAWCTDTALTQPDRLDACAALARTLTEQGTSLAELGVGIAIGTGLGWPAQRLQALQQEHEALTEVSGPPAVGADLGCEAIDRVQGWMLQLATGGERQALRGVLARSGRSLEGWSARHRSNYQAATVAVEAAALGISGGEAGRPGLTP